MFTPIRSLLEDNTEIEARDEKQISWRIKNLLTIKTTQFS